MTAIRSEDVIQSVADALQYISYYHPPDYIANLARAYELEESPAGVAAILGRQRPPRRSAAQLEITSAVPS